MFLCTSPGLIGVAFFLLIPSSGGRCYVCHASLHTPSVAFVWCNVVVALTTCHDCKNCGVDSSSVMMQSQAISAALAAHWRYALSNAQSEANHASNTGPRFVVWGAGAPSCNKNAEPRFGIAVPALVASVNVFLTRGSYR